MARREWFDVPRIHLANTKLDSIDETTTGWCRVMSGKPSAGYSDSLLDDVARARRAVAIRDDRPRLAIKWRCDLVTVHRAPAEGFEPEWVLRGVPVSDVMDTMRAWGQSDWSVALNPGVDVDVWSGLVQQEGIPQMYASANLSEKKISIYNLVADLRSDAYRRWAVENAGLFMEAYGLDAMMMDAKLGWHSHGSPDRSLPDRHPHYGGVVFPSPYGPGEFEEAFAQLIRELAAVSIHPVLVTRPDRPEDPNPWAWMPDDVTHLPLGEYA